MLIVGWVRLALRTEAASLGSACTASPSGLSPLPEQLRFARLCAGCTALAARNRECPSLEPKMLLLDALRLICDSLCDFPLAS